MPENAPLRDPIQAVFWEQMDSIHTYFPGEITAIKDNGLVDVKPSVKIRFFGESTDTPMPIINNVILAQTRSKSSIIRVPRETLKGSKVGVFISEHSLIDWREKKGAAVLPVEGSRFNINDAVAVLGLYPETMPWPVEQLPNTFEIMVNENQKIGIGNTAGDEAFNLLYNLIVNVLVGTTVTTSGGNGTGVFTNASKIVEIQAALAKMTNIVIL